MSNWSCPKCSNVSFDQGEIRTTGGFFSKLFNVQNKRFTSITCTTCQFTEFYRAQQSSLGNVLDFFSN